MPWERRDEMKRQFSLLMGQKNALWWDLPARESLELNRAIYGIEPAKIRRDRRRAVGVAGCDGQARRDGARAESWRADEDGAHRGAAAFAAGAVPRRADDRPRCASARKRCASSCGSTTAENRIVTMLTSHYMQDIEELCQRVIIIDHGRIFFDGPLTAIIDRFATHKILEPRFCRSGRARISSSSAR